MNCFHSLNIRGVNFVMGLRLYVSSHWLRIIVVMRLLMNFGLQKQIQFLDFCQIGFEMDILNFSEWCLMFTLTFFFFSPPLSWLTRNRVGCIGFACKLAEAWRCASNSCRSRSLVGSNLTTGASLGGRGAVKSSLIFILSIFSKESLSK